MITDDPRVVKLLILRGGKHVIFCGIAEGERIPPVVVYKSVNCYDNWSKGGSDGTVDKSSKSGWFDMVIWDQNAVDIDDNLASHFSP